MILDAHTHLDFYENNEIVAMLEEIETNRILSLSVATDRESYVKNQQLAARTKYIIPAIGVHPWKASANVKNLDRLKPLIQKAPMIGEIGLDYKFVEDETNYPTQRYVFEYFLKQARAQNKIVNLHTAGAESQTLDMLESYEILRAIVHWYSGPGDIAESYIEKGYYLTIGVEVLFSEHIQNICQLIPDNLLLTETDNPGGYAWLKKQPGKPKIIHDVIDKIADLRGRTREQIIDMVWVNFLSLIEDDPNFEAFNFGTS